MNPNAKWHNFVPVKFPGGTGMELRSFYGNVMLSTEPNNELGRPNDTACHLDIPMRNCPLFLDDEAIVIDDDVVVKEIQMARALIDWAETLALLLPNPSQRRPFRPRLPNAAPSLVLGAQGRAELQPASHRNHPRGAGRRGRPPARRHCHRRLTAPHLP